jgi:hypothetical protein
MFQALQAEAPPPQPISGETSHLSFNDKAPNKLDQSIRQIKDHPVFFEKSGIDPNKPHRLARGFLNVLFNHAFHEEIYCEPVKTGLSIGLKHIRVIVTAPS